MIEINNEVLFGGLVYRVINLDSKGKLTIKRFLEEIADISPNDVKAL